MNTSKKKTIKNKWSNLSLVGLMQVVATITVILSIVTLFDSVHRYIEQFSHFKLQYLIASLVCALVFLFYKSYKVTVLLLLIAGLNSIFILPWYFSDSKNTKLESKEELTVLLSNVHTNNQKFGKFIELIQKQNPDVFVMQEVNQQWLDEVKEIEEVYKYKHTIPRGDNFGIALFSKTPFQSIKVLNSGAFEIPTLIAKLAISGQQLSIIATHPLPPVNQEYYQFRNSQINKIAEMSRNHQGPLIVVGDLNVSMWSHDYKPLVQYSDQDAGLKNARKGFGLLPTWPAQFQLSMFMIPIDHILVSSHFMVEEIKVGPDIGSDHLPLIVRLGINDLE